MQTSAALARLYDSYAQVVVRDDSNIRAIADLGSCAHLDRCRVAIGQSGSGTRLIAERVLGVAGLGSRRSVKRRGDLDIKQATEALERRRVEAVFWAGGLPTPAITELDDRIAVRFVDLGQVAVGLRKKFPDLYTQTRLPRSAYDNRDERGHRQRRQTTWSRAATSTSASRTPSRPCCSQTAQS